MEAEVPRVFDAVFEVTLQVSTQFFVHCFVVAGYRKAFNCVAMNTKVWLAALLPLRRCASHRSWSCISFAQASNLFPPGHSHLMAIQMNSGSKHARIGIAR